MFLLRCHLCVHFGHPIYQNDQAFDRKEQKESAKKAQAGHSETNILVASPRDFFNDRRFGLVLGVDENPKRLRYTPPHVC